MWCNSFMFLLNKCISTTWTLINTTVQNPEISLNLQVWKMVEIAVLYAVYYIWLSMTEKVLFAVFPQRELKTFRILSTVISLKMELFYRFMRNSEVYIEIRILDIFHTLIIFMISCKFSPLNPFVPDAPFLYSLQTSED